MSRHSIVLCGIVCFIILGGSPAPGSAQLPADAQSRFTPTGPPPAGGYLPYSGALRGRAMSQLAGVPPYIWRHGCGPTAAGMVIGYWDGQGMDQLVVGDAATQTSSVNDMVASGDGAGTHYSDYSVPLDNTGTGLYTDKSETGGAHASCCLADFMETSWSSRGNYYGWSWFSDVDDSLRDYVSWVNANRGTAYSVSTWGEAWGTFTWDDLVTQIDAGNPMVFLVDTDADGYTDHFVTIIGYRDDNGYQEYACLDTWSSGVRWERFRQLGSGVSWGIYGAIFFEVNSIFSDGFESSDTTRWSLSTP